jgi:hypothetical protein
MASQPRGIVNRDDGLVSASAAGIGSSPPGAAGRVGRILVSGYRYRGLEQPYLRQINDLTSQSS